MSSQCTGTHWLLHETPPCPRNENIQYTMQIPYIAKVVSVRGQIFKFFYYYF